MIDDPLLLCYLLESLMLIPSCMIAMSPLWRDLRDRSPFGLGSITVVLLALSVMSSLVCTKYKISSSHVLLPLLPLFFFFYAVVTRKRIIKKAFCFANSLFLSSFCMMYTSYIMAPFEINNTANVLTVPSGIVCLGLTFIMAFVYYFTIGKELTLMLSDEQLNPIWNWLFFIPFSLSLLEMWIKPNDYTAILSGRTRIIALLSLPIIPISVLVLYHMLWLLTNRLKENARLQQENSLLKLEEKRYDQLRDFMDQSRALRHDFRQHLLAIAGLARANENDKLIEYIAPLIKTVTPAHRMLCANKTVDALASHYDTLATDQNTTIDWSLYLPAELPIHDSDICSILGNFLENALKAVKELPEDHRNITASCSMLTDETLGISVKNPFQGTVKFRRNGLPRSSRLGHGIGLQSVSMIVEKYHGSLELSANGGVFSAGALLNTSIENNDSSADGTD